MDWRRLDARKNAISMAAHALYSSRELMGKSTPERADMLKGTAFETLPDEFFNGRLLVKESRDETVTFFNKKSKQDETRVVERYFWGVYPAHRSLTEDTVNALRSSLLPQ